MISCVQRPGVRLTIELHLVPSLRTSGAIPLLTLRDFMARTGKNLTFLLHFLNALYIYSCAINTVFTLASDRPTPNTDIVFSDDDEDRNVRFWGARSRQGLPVRDAYLKAE